ncbi:MAG: alpha/beta fold hydrolase [Deltaproteobacteria bacterium]|nr:alpha/beta fold hydrolase [Deltaproteobacteria bacterium]
MQAFTAPQGHTLHYDRRGSGPPVLLIMGFATPGSAWMGQVDGLSSDHEVIWFNNRGVGGSGSSPGSWTMADFAADALALLDHLGHQTAHVVGQSMGGMIAQHVALEAPHRVRTLSLFATHPGGPGAARPPLAAWPWLLLSGASARRLRVAAMSRLLFPAAVRAQAGFDVIRADLDRDYGPAQPKATVARQLQAMRGHDTRARLAELGSRPVLVMQPGQDILIAPRHSEVLHAAIAGSELLRLPEAGHGAIRQCAGLVNAALRGVFRRG